MVHQGLAPMSISAPLVRRLDEGAKLDTSDWRLSRMKYLMMIKHKEAAPGTAHPPGG